MRRFGQIIKVRPEYENEYIKLHQKIWPEISTLIHACNLRNYSIFIKDGLLFAYYEYIGENYEEDMRMMSDNPVNMEWWKACKPCQEPLETRAPGEWWSDMQEVFHQD